MHTVVMTVWYKARLSLQSLHKLQLQLLHTAATSQQAAVFRLYFFVVFAHRLVGLAVGWVWREGPSWSASALVGPEGRDRAVVPE